MNKRNSLTLAPYFIYSVDELTKTERMEMTEIELLEHVLENRKSGRAAGHGLLLDGEISSAVSVFNMGLYEGYAIAPRTHEVNGFTVPAPETEAPQDEYFIANIGAVEFHQSSYWADHNLDSRRLKRGLIHLAKEAAIANAKAMLGIDPYSEGEK